MTPNIFTAVKAAVTVKDAAERYGLTVSRNGMTCCPFHEDHHPSMKLNEDYFFCFGCHATGDVIDFVSRLFGLSSYDAAKKLASDFGIDPFTPPPAVSAMVFPLEQRKIEGLCASTLIDYECLLKRWKADYAPSTPDESWDERFVTACKELPVIAYLTDCLYAADSQARKELADALLKEGVIARLKECLDGKEECHDAHDADLAA